jgi:hypothetical protein
MGYEWGPVCNRTDWMGYNTTLSSKIYTNSSRDRCAVDIFHMSPRQIIYTGYPGYPTLATSGRQDYDEFVAFCTITTSHVEVEVRCQGHECAVPRVRRSQASRELPGWTSLDDVDCINFEYFSGWFLRVDDASSSGSGALPQGYLAYPSDPSLALHGAIAAPNPGDIGSALFAQRLVQLLNTWWIASIGREIVSSGVEMGKIGRVGEDVPANLRLALRNASGILTREIATIECRIGWFIALVIVSVILITASVVPLALRFWTRTPAFTLLVSTMLKDSPYFETPKQVLPSRVQTDPAS